MELDKSRYTSENFKPRKHQQAFISMLADWIAGRRQDDSIVLHVTPGGGKSAIPQIAAQLIDLRLADALCWVVPRASLVYQGASSFQGDWNPNVNCIIGRNIDPIIPPDDMKTHNVRAYVTTYQAIAAAPTLHALFFGQYRTILILDELHHLVEHRNKAQWTEALRPLVELAEFKVLMTGTLERHDRRRVPFIDYVWSEGREVPKVDISYTRAEALQEQAKTHIRFTYAKGWVHFRDDDGDHSVEISDPMFGKNGKVIRAFLTSGDFVPTLLQSTLNHYQAYRKRTRHQSKAIAVFYRQAEAKQWSEWIREVYGLRVALAISDSDTSQEHIQWFRLPIQEGGAHVLCTVGMAYEGLDVPSITHLACLTNTRSKPWLEQCFDRATRIDYASGLPYARQQAFVWIPDDPKMQSVVEAIREDELHGVALEEKIQPRIGTQWEEFEFEALGSGHTGDRFGDTHTDLSDRDSLWISTYLGHHPEHHELSISELLQRKGMHPTIDMECDRRYQESLSTPIIPPFPSNGRMAPDAHRQMTNAISKASRQAAARWFRGNFREANQIICELHGIERYAEGVGLDLLREIKEFAEKMARDRAFAMQKRAEAQHQRGRREYKEKLEEAQRLSRI
ncbi:uncharacterized protein ML1624-like [Oculina patagonica]